MTEYREENYWSRFADSYEKDGEYIVGKTIMQAIAKKLSQEKSLGKAIEFGCGTGYFTQIVAENARHVVATDFSEKMIETARIRFKESKNITVQRADCSGTSFSDESFDSVIMVNLIHVIKSPFVCLQESRRILGKGGRLIAADLTGHRLSFFGKIKLGCRYVKKWGLPPSHGKSNMSPDDLATLVKKAGFKVVDSQLIRDGVNAIFVKGEKS